MKEYMKERKTETPESQKHFNEKAKTVAEALTFMRCWDNSEVPTWATFKTITWLSRSITQIGH